MHTHTHSHTHTCTLIVHLAVTRCGSESSLIVTRGKSLPRAPGCFTGPALRLCGSSAWSHTALEAALPCGGGHSESRAAVRASEGHLPGPGLRQPLPWLTATPAAPCRPSLGVCGRWLSALRPCESSPPVSHPRLASFELWLSRATFPELVTFESKSFIDGLVLRCSQYRVGCCVIKMRGEDGVTGTESPLPRGCGSQRPSVLSAFLSLSPCAESR